MLALDQGWTVRAASGPVPAELADRLAVGIPAIVPSTAHIDLLGAGLIPDPYDGDNESQLAWVSLVDWTYSTSFSWTSAPGRHDLVAEGLDTVATVILNGTEVARTANMFRSWRWDVAGLLREGRNDLEVRFRSALAYAGEQEQLLGPRPHVEQHPFNAIRKAACTFGWDWGPDLSGSGIWKPMGIDSWSDVRIASVRPIVDGTTVRAEVDLEWERPGSAELTLEVAGHAATVIADGPRASLQVEVPEAELWWPRGYGDQPLYDATVTIGASAQTKRIGFRTVTLDVAPDADGRPFLLQVNGKAIYVKGANWIPDDTFFTRITGASLTASIADAVDANMNLLRVWGGGIYESDAFYDRCDEMGLLVWQDFPFACAAYAEEEPLRSEVDAEAREAVTRIMSHPSLALFNGGNEDIWGHADWDWRSELGDRTWGAGYYLELLPAIVAELAPGIPYSVNSPYSFDERIHPNDDAHGTSHLWDVWNRKDYTAYADHRPRFVSEFGFQGPPAWSTLFSVVHDEPADPYGREMLVHQKAEDGNRKLERGLGAHLHAPATIEDWHWATQLNQARAVAHGIRWFRSLYPLNRGAIVWQLNDCWPVVSWSAVDDAGIRKPLWYALREVFADRLLIVQGDRVLAHNDSDAPWEGVLEVARIGGSSKPFTLAVAPRSIASFDVSPAEGVLVASAGTVRAFGYPVEDPELGLDPDAVTASALRVPGGYEVVVAATSLAKDVTLLVDRVDSAARVDDGMVTLLPGESHRFRVILEGEVDPAAFTAPEVVRSANDLFRNSPRGPAQEEGAFALRGRE